MKNSTIIGIIGLAVASVGAYFYLKSKKTQLGSVASGGNTPSASVTKPYKIKVEKEDPISLVINNKKYWFPNPTSYLAYGFSEVKIVPKSELDSIPSGQNIDESGRVSGETETAFQEGNYTIKTQTENPVFLVRNGKKHWFINEKAFLSYLFTEPKLLTDNEFDSIPVGGSITDDGKIRYS
jgi:hypothetical protein